MANTHPGSHLESYLWAAHPWHSTDEDIQGQFRGLLCLPTNQPNNTIETARHNRHEGSHVSEATARLILNRKCVGGYDLKLQERANHVRCFL